MNELLYLIIEFLKVSAAYIFLLYVWPLIVFKGFLKDKSRTFKFAFCVVFMINAINMVVLLFGSVHVLNAWVIRILFYGVFLFSIVRNIRIGKNEIKAIKHLTTGTIGRKTFYNRSFSYVGKYFAKFWNKVTLFFKGHITEYVILIVLILYAILYFSWNAFNSFSYGASDVYVHHSWIYGLVQGEAFSAGVYPEGMHCFVYALNALFNVDIFSVLLFIAGINISATLVSAYVFFKELFKWKYAPILSIALFLILDVNGAQSVLGMSRLAWALPQEFGFPMIFLCAAFLIRYLKDSKRESWKKLFNVNLIIFTLALAGTISIHFYVTIMAFFVCLMVVIPLVTKLFKNKSFIQLVIAVLIGIFIAALPMAIALAGGKKFQGSINWALDYMKGNTDAKRNELYFEKKIADIVSFDFNNAQAAFSFGLFNINHKNASVRAKNVQESKMADVYKDTYVFMYGEKRAALILIFQISVFLIWIGLKIFGIIKQKKDPEYDSGRYDGFLILVLLGVLFTLLNHFQSLGLPEIFEIGRLCAITQILVLGILFVPLDLIMSFPLYSIPNKIGAAVALATLVTQTALTVMTGNYHGYLFYYLERHSASVKCTISIMEDIDKDNFTLVSTTDELYQIIEDGYHEEAVTFVNSTGREKSYTLPTEYVFIFVEKKPIQYSQYQFATGPSWLALDRYPKFFAEPMTSRYPEVVTSEISEEYVDMDYYFSSNFDASYKDLYVRTILESKLYDWCRKFDNLYPGVLKTYYEDDDFVCYYFKQNPRNNYELSIND